MILEYNFMYPTYKNDIKLIIFKKDLYIKFC